MNPKRVLPRTKRVPQKGYPVGTAEEPFQVLDSTFFSKSAAHGPTTECSFVLVLHCIGLDCVALDRVP